MRNRHDCAYYDGGFCKKGLPGTLCEIKGCMAFTEKPRVVCFPIVKMEVAAGFDSGSVNVYHGDKLIDVLT